LAGDRTGNSGTVRRLVIVESPTKARKIAGYLGPNYIVESSRGHIRDLPKGAADVPAKYKTEKWARLGVNVDAEFEPLYVVSPDKKATVTELKNLLKGVDELYLATDGDREGEAIAWHLLETLKPRIPVRRMVFHEITESAIRAAAENPRDLDTDLVDAQETRRILDRLYGYEVSPVLWKKVAPRLSAGRVQSVATRIIVQRERERMAFRSAGYWDVLAELDASVSDPNASPPRFNARLVSVAGKRVATGRDFDSLGALRKPDDVVVLDESAATELDQVQIDLGGGILRVVQVEERLPLDDPDADRGHAVAKNQPVGQIFGEAAGDGVGDGDVIPRPVELLGPRPRRAGHPSPEHGVKAEPFHPIRQRGRVSRRNQKAFDFIPDHRAGIRSHHAREAARQRFVGHDGRSFKEGRKDEDVGLGHPTRNFGVRQTAQQLDVAQQRFQGAGVLRQGPQKLELPARSADLLPRFQKVLDPFPLRDPPREEERAVTGGRRRLPRAEPPDVSRVGDHAHLVRRRAVPDQDRANVFGWNENPIGQRKVS